MDVYNKNREGVQIQIKPLNKKQKSKSFTVHDISSEEAFNRVFFLFEQLSMADGNITIIHYKTKEDPKNE